MMASGPDLRQDPFTGNWVVMAPERGRRPDAFRREGAEVQGSETCPFCPGREAETPPEVWRLPGPAGGWRVRVVPNKFASFSGGPAPVEEAASGFVRMPAAGRHEVVIEAPEHTADLATMPVEAVRDVLEAYRARYRALREESPALVLIFRNHGARAGTSLAHPHSQIVSMPVVPNEARHRFDVARRYAAETGTNLALDILGRELADGRRIIRAGPRFVAFQPFAAAAPFETWLMPRRPASTFGGASDADLDDLAALLRGVLVGMRRLLNDPDYNFVILSAPPGEEDDGAFVWHLRIVPRLTTEAGLELGSGVRVNPSLPEETAAMLRDATVEDRAFAAATMLRSDAERAGSAGARTGRSRH